MSFKIDFLLPFSGMTVSMISAAREPGGMSLIDKLFLLTSWPFEKKSRLLSMSSCEITEAAPIPSRDWLGELMGDTVVVAVIVAVVVVETEDKLSKGAVALVVVAWEETGTGTGREIAGLSWVHDFEEAMLDEVLVLEVLIAGGVSWTGAAAGFSGVRAITPLQNSFLPNLSLW
jgi:hypothetical protein